MKEERAYGAGEKGIDTGGVDGSATGGRVSTRRGDTRSDGGRHPANGVSARARGDALDVTAVSLLISGVWGLWVGARTCVQIEGHDEDFRRRWSKSSKDEPCANPVARS